jgi:hypothetical protein
MDNAENKEEILANFQVNNLRSRIKFSKKIE